MNEIEESGWLNKGRKNPPVPAVGKKPKQERNEPKKSVSKEKRRPLASEDIRKYMSVEEKPRPALKYLNRRPDPQVFRDYDTVPTTEEPEPWQKKKGGVRKKEERERLKGYDCPCCHKYYDALNLDEKERAEWVEEVSRHRAAVPPPKTPEHFWNPQFLTTEQCKQKGWFHDENPVYVPEPRRAFRKLYDD